MSKKIKIILVDDHKVVRRGLFLLFANEPDIEIIGEANDGVEALLLIDKKRPDIVVTDITMPNMNGIELTGVIKKKYPKIKVLVLSMHLDQDYAVRAIEAGARGYLSKDADGDEITKAVYIVNSGEIYLAESIANLLAMGVIRQEKKVINKSSSKDSILTKRELEILSHIVKGESSQEIASELDISVRTVNVHKYNVMKKLDAPNSVSLVRIAMDQKLVSI